VRPEGEREAIRPGAGRDREGSRIEARPREVEREREPEMAEAGEGASAAPLGEGRGEDRGRRRRRRGRRGRGEGGVGREEGGRRIVAESGTPVGIAEPEVQAEPNDAFQDEPREELHQDRIARLRQIGPGNRQPLERDRGPRETREREPRETREREPREREPSDREPLLSSDELATLGRQVTDDLLKAMGFVGTVTAKADGANVDVTAEVPDGEDLLTGRKGEVRQALQHLLNRMINRGEGTRYHLQLEVNDFWQRREDELVGIAKTLADEAVASQGEVFTEYLNSQERRIIHVTLREDARVKTYAIGEGMIKKVAVAPADFPEDTRSDE
jgi:predicted RNA-binding protein Jag